MNNAQQSALEAIDGFILYYTSNADEQYRMSEAARDHVLSDHVLAEATGDPIKNEMLAMLQRVIDLLNDPDADSFDANQLEREIEQLITKATR